MNDTADDDSVRHLNLREVQKRLTLLLDTNPREAVRQARLIDYARMSGKRRSAAMVVRASILVDGGSASRQLDAIEEGTLLLRELAAASAPPLHAYNLANALVARAELSKTGDWLNDHERSRTDRAESRRLYRLVATAEDQDDSLRSQAWTNLANQFTQSVRLGEAHDARLAALAIEPGNGVAAALAARDLLWLYNQGGCSELTKIEAAMLARVAKANVDRMESYVGPGIAKQLAEMADQLGDPPKRSPHTDAFVRWVEEERLTLGPAVELVDPSLGKIDWLMLPGILEREERPSAITPPPIFAMFNSLKADFILARDLAWREVSETAWPTTGRFADTLDYAVYGPGTSALVVAHRTALDLLDKVAVTANKYFEIGEPPDRVYFGSLWRPGLKKKNGPIQLAAPVEAAIRDGVCALYGLVELAEDYSTDTGILRAQKDLRNAGTHRFIVLHDEGVSAREAAEVEHYGKYEFLDEVINALRIARSAIQTLCLAITQHEATLRRKVPGRIGTLEVLDHDYIRGVE